MIMYVEGGEEAVGKWVRAVKVSPFLGGLVGADFSWMLNGAAGFTTDIPSGDWGVGVEV